MPDTLRAPVRIDQPVAPLPVGGLLSVADVTDVTDPHFINGVTYESWLCGVGGIAPGLCDVAPGVEIDPEKKFTGSEVVEGYPFATYAGVICDLLGRPYGAQAQGRLAGSEEFLVGRAFEQILFAVGDPEPVCDEDADICDIIGALEQWAGENFSGRPVLHMNRFNTAQAAAAQQIVLDPLSGLLSTVQGTPVANSPGYDSRIFITGPVHLWRTAVDSYAVDAQMTNQALGLAERVYTVAWDCGVGYCTTVPAPDVLDVAPESGSADGGEVITITGSGFTESEDA